MTAIITPAAAGDQPPTSPSLPLAADPARSVYRERAQEHLMTSLVADPRVAAVLADLRAELAGLRAEVRDLRTSQPRALSMDPAERLDFGRLVIDPAARQALVDGAAHTLPAREWDILTYLAARPGQVVGYDELLREVWGGAESASRPNLTEHVRRIRQRLRPVDPISTVRSSGYRWDWRPGQRPAEATELDAGHEGGRW